jgi:hypothetical protein
LAGTWCTNFAKNCTQPDFNLTEYLKRLQGDLRNDASLEETDHPTEQPLVPWYARDSASMPVSAA